MWHFRGTPHYLDQQGTRLGVAKVLTDRARQNSEIHRVSTLLAQLCERWHRAPKDEDGVAQVNVLERAQIKGTLEQTEQEAAKLHCLAAASASMIDEAYAAFGIDRPAPVFRVRSIVEDNTPDVRPVRLQPDYPRSKVTTNGISGS
jgi:hypothetical protein